MLKINDIEVQNVTLNGVALDKLKFNDVEVWGGQPAPTAMTLRFNKPGQTDYTYIAIGNDNINYCVRTDINNARRIRLIEYTGRRPEYEGSFYIYDDDNQCYIGASSDGWSITFYAEDELPYYEFYYLWNFEGNYLSCGVHGVDWPTGWVVDCNTYADGAYIYHDKKVSAGKGLECTLVPK